jgi:hypothetical protein
MTAGEFTDGIGLAGIVEKGNCIKNRRRDFVCLQGLNVE